MVPGVFVYPYKRGTFCQKHYSIFWSHETVTVLRMYDHCSKFSLKSLPAGTQWILCILREWFTRCAFCLKPFWHISQTYGFSPVCTRSWRIRSVRCINTLVQKRQLKVLFIMCNKSCDIFGACCGILNSEILRNTSMMMITMLMISIVYLYFNHFEQTNIPINKVMSWSSQPKDIILIVRIRTLLIL